MKPQLLNLVLVSALCLILSSCKDSGKEVTPETPTSQTLILGSWKDVFFATDDNVNQQLDDSEKEFSDPQDGELTITFYSNGVGKTIFKEEGLEPEVSLFSWSISNNNILNVIDSYTYYNGKDSITEYDTSISYIKTLNTSALLLEQKYTDTFFSNTTIIEWYGLERIK